ncbi:bromodomain and WD repeat-containing protein 1 [Planoprotostelium fungivorum]|uniref:Bromodomain and WD repeat-containing protein 1 n=1 Tax=Planoprotostelium fungivorum TaxID=1890364 RepID=A0A2P6NGG0_9EUKA|nr:bromodomain and WD repeat-containing protein 1 [Planoprotostelium fungivorum]
MTEEHIDVCDEQGKKTGEVLPRKEIHRLGKWHRCVHVWLFKKSGQVLVQKRAAIKESWPNMWDISSAGHISAGDDSLTSAQRELEEELGVKKEAKDFHFLFTSQVQAVLRGGAYLENEHVDVYLVEMDEGYKESFFTLQQSEVAAVKWMDIDELVSAFSSPTIERGRSQTVRPLEGKAQMANAEPKPAQYRGHTYLSAWWITVKTLQTALAFDAISIIRLLETEGPWPSSVTVLMCRDKGQNLKLFTIHMHAYECIIPKDAPCGLKLSFLILQWMNSKGLSQIAKQAEAAMMEKDLLPVAMKHTGQKHQMSLEELKKRHPHVAENHLESLLQRLLILSHTQDPPPQPIFSLISPDPSYNLIKEGRQKKIPFKTYNAIPDAISRTTSSQRCLLKPHDPKPIDYPSALVSYRMDRGPSWIKPMTKLYQYRHLKKIRGHAFPAYCVLFDHVGQRLITGSDDHFVRIFSTRSAHLIRTLKGHVGDIVDLAITRDNQILATACNMGAIRIWDFNTYHPITVLSIPNQVSFSSISFCGSLENMYLVSGDYNQNAIMWPVDQFVKDNVQPILLNEQPVSPSEAMVISVSKGGTMFVTAGDTIIRLWQVDPPQCIGNLKGHEQNVLSIQWANESERILSGGYDNTVRIWKNDGGDWKSIVLPLDENPATKASTTTLLWSLDDRYAIVAAMKGHQKKKGYIMVWESRTGVLKYKLEEHTDRVYALETHPKDPRIFFSGGYDGNVIIWDLQTGMTISKFQNSINVPNEGIVPVQILDGRFSPTGDCFAVTDSRGFISLYGMGNEQHYQNTPVEQSFQSDHHYLRLDSSLNVYDDNVHLPAHLVELGEICPLLDPTPYEKQTRPAEFAPPKIDEDEWNFRKSIYNAKRANEVTMVHRTVQPAPFRSKAPDNSNRVAPPSFVAYETETNFDPVEADNSEEEEEFVEQEDDDEYASDEEDKDRYSERLRNKRTSTSANTSVESSTPKKEGSRRRLRSASGQEEFSNDENDEMNFSGSDSDNASVSDGEMDLIDDSALLRDEKKRKKILRGRKGVPRYWHQWLLRNHDEISSYVPQMGDEVYYFCQGDKEYRDISDASIRTVYRTNPALLCKVVGVQYHVATQPWCEISLEIDPKHVIDEPTGELAGTSSEISTDGKQEQTDDVPHGDTSLQNVDTPSLPPNRFKVGYRADSDSPDCLCLSSIVRGSLNIPWRIGDRFMSFMSSSWFFGIVLDLAPPNEQYPDSPWESYKVKWELDGTEANFSPWEMYPVNDVNNNNNQVDPSTTSQTKFQPHAPPETLSQEETDRLLQGLHHIILLKMCRPFRLPVNVRQVRNYLKWVAYPMDLSTMTKRLKERYYRRIDALVWDINTMYGNAHTYNQDGSEIVQEAKKLTDWIKCLVLDPLHSLGALGLPSEESEYDPEGYEEPPEVQEKDLSMDTSVNIDVEGETELPPIEVAAEAKEKKAEKPKLSIKLRKQDDKWAHKEDGNMSMEASASILSDIKSMQPNVDSNSNNNGAVMDKTTAPAISGRTLRLQRRSYREPEGTIASRVTRSTRNKRQRLPSMEDDDDDADEDDVVDGDLSPDVRSEDEYHSSEEDEEGRHSRKRKVPQRRSTRRVQRKRYLEDDEEDLPEFEDEPEPEELFFDDDEIDGHTTKATPFSATNSKYWGSVSVDSDSEEEMSRPKRRTRGSVKKEDDGVRMSR